ncbi:MAG: RNA polymerase sigma factor [bacterium]
MFLKKNVVDKAKHGDKKALESLYTDHIRGLFIFVRTKVNTEEQAEDMCSETFLKAFSKLDSFQERSSFKSWLYTIAHNLILDSYKKNSMEVKIKDFDPVQEEEEEQSVRTSIDDLQQLKDVMEQLPENYRTVLELRFLSNCNIRETAELMEISANNVKVLQNRALKKAKKIANDF